MSARKLAAAVLTAALAGPASAQMPPAPLPLGGGAGPGMPAGPIAPGYPPGADFAPPGMGYPSGGCPPGFPGGPLDDVGQIRGPKAWIGAEYLVYWTKNAPVNSPLATGGPAAGFGIFGTAGTAVVLGNEEFDFREQGGLRVHGGVWLTDSIGVEGNVFVLPSKDQSIGTVTATGDRPTLARPFFDSNLRAQNVRLLSRPNTFTGNISADATLGMWGAEITPVLRAIDNGGRLTVDGMLGFKHLSLEESLSINDVATAGPLGVANFNGVGYRNATTFVNDYFSTSNRIYSVLLGTRFNLHMDAFTFSLTSKVGLGANNQTVLADGSTTLVGPFPAPSKVGGGLLAVGPNVGKSDRSRFVYVPELNLNMTVQLTSQLTLSLGYNFLYISSVVRPGDQLDSPINPVFVPSSSNFGGRTGQPFPVPQFNTSSFYANGLNLGLSVGF